MCEFSGLLVACRHLRPELIEQGWILHQLSSSFELMAVVIRHDSDFLYKAINNGRPLSAESPRPVKCIKDSIFCDLLERQGAKADYLFFVIKRTVTVLVNISCRIIILFYFIINDETAVA